MVAPVTVFLILQGDRLICQFTLKDLLLKYIDYHRVDSIRLCLSYFIVSERIDRGCKYMDTIFSHFFCMVESLVSHFDQDVLI